MTDQHYEYATLQLVPSCLTDHCLTVGVILHCRAAEYLDLRVAIEPGLWSEHLPGLDAVLAARALGDLARVCRGGAEGGAIGLLPPGERFHWLTAPRSAVVRPSELRGGRCQDLRATLEHLFTLSQGRREPGP
ncbi:MAG TPA: DUF3037 domain-containing protein [Anaerolineae bacterium]|nr:DUF3037 domain-containing protein [Anaerolineae bacterium]